MDGRWGPLSGHPQKLGISDLRGGAAGGRGHTPRTPCPSEEGVSEGGDPRAPDASIRVCRPHSQAVLGTTGGGSHPLSTGVPPTALPSYPAP